MPPPPAVITAETPPPETTAPAPRKRGCFVRALRALCMAVGFTVIVILALLFLVAMFL